MQARCKCNSISFRRGLCFGRTAKLWT